MAHSKIPDLIYVELCPDTNEKRWHPISGMGIPYMHEDRASEDAEAAAKAAVIAEHQRLMDAAVEYEDASVIRAFLRQETKQPRTVS